MLIIGHRGAAGLEPENTIKSIKKAIELRVDMIEVDVQSCSTGEVVLFHDTSMKRLTGHNGSIGKLTLEEVKKLRVGGEQIPTLEEAMEAIKDYPLNIEIKDRESGEKVLELLRKKGLEKKTLISSKYHGVLCGLKKKEQGLRVGPVTAMYNPFLLSWMGKHNAYSVTKLYPFVTKRFVERCHKIGVKVYMFPHGTKAKMDVQTLKRWGVDGAFFNYPGKKPF